MEMGKGQEVGFKEGVSRYCSSHFVLPFRVSISLLSLTNSFSSKYSHSKGKPFPAALIVSLLPLCLLILLLTYTTQFFIIDCSEKEKKLEVMERAAMA